MCKVFINEDLMNTTATLFREERALVKSHVLHAAWTTGEVRFVKISDHPRCHAKKTRPLSNSSSVS